MSPAIADKTMHRSVPTPVTDLSEFTGAFSGAKGTNSVEWNNQRPEQQRALNQFYQSINPSQNTQPSLERQQHVKQLRSMTPQQRQQMFLNYIQQNR
jgi:hypothetical protein